MALETTAILRSVLFQLMIAESLDDGIDAVKVMCSKDDIAAVEHQVNKYLGRKKKA